MRLEILERNPTLRMRLAKAVLGWTPGPAAVLGHRPEFCGQHFRQALRKGMRGPAEWSRPERELFAAFVSAKNQCVF